MVFGKYMNRYYLKYWYWLLFGALCLLLVDTMELKIPEFYRMIINGLNDGVVEYEGAMVPFDIDFLLDNICLPFCGIMALMIVGRFFWRFAFFGSAIKVQTNMRSQMFDHCLKLSQSYYQDNKVGNMMSLFTNDLETIQECFGDGALMLFDAIIQGGLSFRKMLHMNGWMTLLAMIPMALLLAIATVVGKYMTKKWDARQEAFSNLSDFSQESFSGIAVVKAFVKETKELLAFKKLNKDNIDANVEFVKAATLLRVLVNLFVESVICIILGYGGYLVYTGSFNAGQLIEFISYFTTIVWPVMAVSELIDMTSRGKASLSRITELLDAEVDVKDAEDVLPIEELQGNIEFRNLNFCYPGTDYEVLKDVSFKINQGENIGIIGKTGSGKSTLVDLILRTYNVPDGTIFLDGTDINDIPLHTVREYCAYVPQDNFLFSDTIANNIAFASNITPGSDSYNETVELAAKMSDVDDNIRGFSQGYDTVLGERGVTVSGGQKQRISIARALMKNANILILDDSVSAVDVDTEQIILSNLKKLRAGKTTLLIAHRISTVENMDKILFMDEGRVAAVGSHVELYQTCPAYKTMVDMQRLEDETAKDDAKEEA